MSTPAPTFFTALWPADRTPPASTPVTIVCPRCGSHEAAQVEHTPLFPIFLHDCAVCGYVIQEDEWQPLAADESEVPA